MFIKSNTKGKHTCTFYKFTIKSYVFAWCICHCPPDASWSFFRHTTPPTTFTLAHTTNSVVTKIFALPYPVMLSPG